MFVPDLSVLGDGLFKNGLFHVTVFLQHAHRLKVIGEYAGMNADEIQYVESA